MARFDVVIVDYGMANLRSVQKAFEQVGVPAHITSDPNEIRDAHKVVLPGVGAFQDAIAKLRDTQLADVLVEHIHGGQPFLGICLGLQMLFTQGHEDGLHEGLNLTPGEVVRFPKQAGLKVPHMGWNSIRLTQPNCPLFRGLPAEPYFTSSTGITLSQRTMPSSRR